MARRPGWIRPACILLALSMMAQPLAALQGAANNSARLHTIQLKAGDGQILSYRPHAGPTDVLLRGRGISVESRIKLKVESRPGFMEIDINRGDIRKLQTAHRYGKDFLTYVLWAVSVAGMASNLGEITFDGKRAISINVTTPYQTFWLMVTAEPNFAVTDPSPHVVLYSVDRNSTGGKPTKRALPIAGDLFYYTHYTDYDSVPGPPVGNAPNELLQARKAVELASRAGILGVAHKAGTRMSEEEKRTRRTLEQANVFLAEAEKFHREKPRGRRVVQFARTAAQIAENARALAMGAVGGALVRQLEGELKTLRSEVARLSVELKRVRGRLAAADSDIPPPPPPEEVSEEIPEESFVPKPVVWLGFLGWGLALLLLFRRKAG